MTSPGQSPQQTELQVASLLAYAQALSLDISRRWWWLANDRVIGASAAIASGGRTSLLLLSHAQLRNAPAEHVVPLINCAFRAEAAQGAHLVQCLLNPEENQLVDALCKAGFHEITTMIYMELSLGDFRSLEWRRSGQDYDWVEYSPAMHGELARLLFESYKNSLDCPELTGLRDIDDIIAGHQSSGRFEPGDWQILLVSGRAVGCILLCSNPLGPSMEISYMGVIPQRRSFGIGTMLLHHGLKRAQQAGCTKVTLAVDQRNTPGIKTYIRAGFCETGRRRVLVRLAESTPSVP